MITELTNKVRKQVASLDDARARKAEGLFVAEGTKCVLDTIAYFKCRMLFATDSWLQRHGKAVGGLQPLTVKRADMERMSHLTTPPEVLAVYEIPDVDPGVARPAEELVIALDRVQDPGNLGTIMRIADWYGIRTIVASHDTVDVYNPKVVQATMGAISRVKVVYVDLPAYLSSLPESVPVFGTFLDGKNIYDCELSTHGVIVMGNEGQGISNAVRAQVSQKLFIPSFPAGGQTSESLNVGMATAITVAEFRRRQIM
jgi:TrmH family RNA methyltransferase